MNFLNPYSRNDYKDFFQNKLLSDDFELIGEKLSLEFKPQHLKQVELLGRDKSIELDVYEILHESENDPRVGLSKDIFRLMSKYGTKRALAILYSPGSKNYRLSLATVELSLEGSKIKREYSNPRRYSFFLGPDSKIHTPSEFLISKGRISDFNDLQSRFSIEVVNKEFYQRIAVQFSKLVGGNRKIGSKSEAYKRTLLMPSVKEQHIFQEFAVRLIGRLVFCWFLKMKKSDSSIPLISSKVLSLESAKTQSNYYHNILEKLFFEVLNTPIDERKKEFKLEPYLSIPFLNGGLFSPHNDDYYETDRSGVSKHINTLKVPDKWLQDFIEILEIYNFTVDENTSVDVDLSVDPEMLGRIFENLLAEINPATGETARKATGSYYTPRPIVEYMVDECLKQYLVLKTGIDEQKITELLSYSDGGSDLLDVDIIKIIDAFDKVKILDPACGSGAFPIGILNKMLLVLQRVDPESKLWLEKQLARIEASALRSELEKKLEGENVEYVHKLGIIQNSIYGVDIQPIAAEISKLRCFLSLIVEEKVYDNKKNRGILPLPNLEFKFVAANTLISLPKTTTQSELFNVNEEIDKLEKLRKLYFNSRGKEKQIIEKDFLNAQSDLATSYLSKQAKDSRAIKLANWDPFSDDASDWFDPEWMFGINSGFDVVIGNPPYVDSEVMTLNSPDQREQLKVLYKTAKGNWDLFVPFIEQGINLLKNSGIFAYIIPNKLLAASYTKELREYLLQRYILEIRDYSRLDIFIEQDVYPITIVLKNCSTKNNDDVKMCVMDENLKISNANQIHYQLFKKDIYWDRYFFNESILNLLMHLRSNQSLSKMNLNVLGAATVGEAYLIKKKLIDAKKIVGFKLVNTGTIDPYKIFWGIKSTQYIKDQYLFPQILSDDLLRINKNRVIQSSSNKIIIAGMSKQIEAVYDSGSLLAGKSTSIILGDEMALKLILPILNSKVMAFYVRYYYHSLKMAGGYININTEIINDLPIPIIKESDYILKLVNKILNTKEFDPEGDISRITAELDESIYKLYGLSQKDINLIELNTIDSQNN